MISTPDESKTGRIGKINHYSFAVAILVALAVLLRLQKLQRSLTGDEAITFNRHAFAPAQTLLLQYLDPNQHTLFSILSNFSMGLFEENEFWFRFPSFLAGVLALPLFYILGCYLLDSKLASLVASCLLVVSTPHLIYSQAGRGYALTFFLVLVLIFSSTKISYKENIYGWGALLITSGFCLVLTLPTNSFFLAGAAIYSLVARWEAGKSHPISFKKDLAQTVFPFVILLVLVAGYFFIIRAGLFSGVKNFSPYVPKGVSHFLETAAFLISPWSPWAYLIFAYGVVNLKSRRRLFHFLVIFVMPVLLAFLTGLVGFPRVYIYLLPFVLMIVALGIVTIISQSWKFASGAGYTVSVVFLLGMLIAPVSALLETETVTGVSIAEAKQTLSYVQETIPHDHLILVSSDNPVLSRYLDQRIQGDMFGFTAGNRLEKIILMLPSEVLPENFIFDGYYPQSSMRLPDHTFKLIKAIGNLRIYELDLSIIRFIPAVYDPDYETQLGFQNAQISAVDHPKVLGNQALMARKQKDQELLIATPVVKTVNIAKSDAYLLFIYVRQSGQKSKALLVDYDGQNWPPAKMVYLNKFLGVFSAGSNFEWQMLFILSPIAEGRHNLQEIIHLQLGDEIAYFDGFQSFLLVK